MNKTPNPIAVLIGAAAVLMIIMFGLIMFIEGYKDFTRVDGIYVPKSILEYIIHLVGG